MVDVHLYFMLVNIELRDVLSQKVLQHTSREYAFNIGNPSDAGCDFVSRWLDSVIRQMHHSVNTSLELSIVFSNIDKSDDNKQLVIDGIEIF